MLDQRLRRWPTLNQHLVSVPCWLGKILLSICWRSTVSSPHMREMVIYFLIDVAQVYRVYMIWELALNAAMGMERI